MSPNSEELRNLVEFQISVKYLNISNNFIVFQLGGLQGDFPLMMVGIVFGINECVVYKEKL